MVLALPFFGHPENRPASRYAHFHRNSPMAIPLLKYSGQRGYLQPYRSNLRGANPKKDCRKLRHFQRDFAKTNRHEIPTHPPPP